MKNTTLTPSDIPVLYISPGDSRSQAASEFLGAHGIDHLEKDISEDSDAAAQFEKLSRGNPAPLLQWDGDVLTNFSEDELVAFLHAHDQELEDS